MAGVALGLLVTLATVSTMAAVRISREQRRTLREHEATRDHYHLALEALNSPVLDVNRKLGSRPGTLELRRDILETARAGLEKIARSTEVRDPERARPGIPSSSRGARSRGERAGPARGGGRREGASLGPARGPSSRLVVESGLCSAGGRDAVRWPGNPIRSSVGGLRPPDRTRSGRRTEPAPTQDPIRSPDGAAFDIWPNGRRPLVGRPNRRASPRADPANSTTSAVSWTKRTPVILTAPEIQESLLQAAAAFPRCSRWDYNNEINDAYAGFSLWGEFSPEAEEPGPRRFFVTFDPHGSTWRGHLSIGKPCYYWSSADLGDAHLAGTNDCETQEGAISSLRREMVDLFAALVGSAQESGTSPDRGE